MPDKFTVALIQMSCGREPADNLAKALDRVSDAARKGANVVCLPELFQTQYFCQREDAALFDLAETIPGAGTEKLAAAALKNKIVLIASLFEKRAPGLYHNTAVIFDSDGALRGTYRKMHIPDDPLDYVNLSSRPAISASRPLTRLPELGTLVCWDQWYPEGARLTALQGASILFYPTAIGWHPAEKADLARHNTMPRAPSSALTQSQTVLCRSGGSRRLRDGRHPRQFRAWRRPRILGRAFFCDPVGRVLAEASHDKEEILLARWTCGIEETRRNWPFLRDRRIDSYAAITSRMLDEK